ncbi:MAG: hypothetical protein ACTTJJ_05980 [Prevotella fusca]|uniref:hypothetical protein n=1 Tax=Prevotella fusca TaxID=589436 RepID=UPI003F9FE1FC
MTKLQDVIASVLRDVLSAQHEANLLTEALAEQYEGAGVIHQLNLPAVTIGDMEITFRFAIDSDGGESGEISEDSIQSMDVIVDADRLAVLPERAVHSLLLKISPQDSVKITES